MRFFCFSSIMSQWVSTRTRPGIQEFTATESSIVPVGIDNLGNTCYLNSILQTFAFSIRASLHLSDIRWEERFEAYEELTPDEIILKEVCDFMTYTWAATGESRVFYPDILTTTLSVKDPAIGQGMKDAHEILFMLMDIFERTLNQLGGERKIKSINALQLTTSIKDLSTLSFLEK